MKKTVQVAAFGVIVKNDTYLLTKRVEPDRLTYHDLWQIPGGGHEFAETPEETLHREMREELGIEVKNVRFIPHIFTRVAGNWQGVFLCYVCQMKDENQKIILNEEASEYGWFSLKQAKELKSLEGLMEILEVAETCFNGKNLL